MPPTPSLLRLSKTDAGSHQYVVVGQSIEVEIPANMRSQQPWFWTAGFDVLEQSSSPQAYKHGAVIQPMQRWRFRVKSAGNSMLRLSEAREGDAYGSKAKFEIRITASQPAPR